MNKAEMTETNILTNLEGILKASQIRMFSGAALTAAAIADAQLQQALLTKMRKLSRTAQDELFNGYGPLSSFSAKIAMAFALELIDSTAQRRLTIARQIRNKFAHCSDSMSFESPEIHSLIRKFPDDFDKSMSNEFIYFWHLRQVEISLVASVGTSILGKNAADA